MVERLCARWTCRRRRQICPGAGRRSRSRAWPAWSGGLVRDDEPRLHKVLATFGKCERAAPHPRQPAGVSGLHAQITLEEGLPRTIWQREVMVTPASCDPRRGAPSTGRATWRPARVIVGGSGPRPAPRIVVWRWLPAAPRKRARRRRRRDCPWSGAPRSQPEPGAAFRTGFLACSRRRRP